MKKILIIDSCVRREESRTKQMLDKAVETLKNQHKDWSFETLTLMDMDLKYWNTESLKVRDGLLLSGQYDAPQFALGNQFREADGIVIAAPFWDLSVPAMLKVYIENISADGITFSTSADGLKGICKFQWLLFLTTREESGKVRIWKWEVLIWRRFPAFLEAEGIAVCLQMAQILSDLTLRQSWEKHWKRWKKYAFL